MAHGTGQMELKPKPVTAGAYRAKMLQYGYFALYFNFCVFKLICKKRYRQEDLRKGYYFSLLAAKFIILQNKEKTGTVNRGFSAKMATDNGFTNQVFFIDNGVFNVKFERPNFKHLIAEIEAGLRC